MKKILFSVVLVSIFIGKSVFAQDSETKLFHFGLKVAPSVSWFNPDNKKYANDGVKFGFGYGLITEFGFSKNYAFSTGLEVLNAGGKLVFPKSPINTYYNFVNDEATPVHRDTFQLLDRTYRIRYVNIPLSLKLKTNPIGSMTYFGMFGIDFSILWKAKADDYGQFIDEQTPRIREDVEIGKGSDRDVNFMRLALNVGLGAEYNLSGSTSAVFSVNYNNGFTNALRKTSKNLYDQNNAAIEAKAIFNYVSLTVGVLF
jgi:hypothetical protein